MAVGFNRLSSPLSHTIFSFLTPHDSLTTGKYNSTVGNLQTICREWQRLLWNYKSNPDFQKMDKIQIKETLLHRVTIACSLFHPTDECISFWKDPAKTMEQLASEEYFDEFIKNSESPLTDFLYTDKREYFNLLIAAGINIFGRDFSKNTALHAAARKGQRPAIQVLLKQGIPVNTKGWDGVHPLHESIRSEQFREMRYLIDFCGADLRAIDDLDASPLHLMTSHPSLVPFVERLISTRRISPNIQNREKETPLHHAARENSVEMIRCLVKWGADLNALNKNLQSPLHHSLIRGHTKASLELIDLGAKIEGADFLQRTPLYFALQEGCDQVVYKLFEKGISIRAELKKGILLLHAACLGGKIDFVKAIIKKGGDINSCDAHGCSPLHYAAIGKHPEIISLLVSEYHINVNIPSDNETSLHLAAHGNSIETIQRLLDLGADPSLKTSRGETALDRALRVQKRSKEPLGIVELLRK
ncbi:MAG: ankyrin repeat domain-containing protein [Chlamydiota bacterium]